MPGHRHDSKDSQTNTQSNTLVTAARLAWVPVGASAQGRRVLGTAALKQASLKRPYHPPAHSHVHTGAKKRTARAAATGRAQKEVIMAAMVFKSSSRAAAN